jgi:hypothetical protein
METRIFFNICWNLSLTPKAKLVKFTIRKPNFPKFSQFNVMSHLACCAQHPSAFPFTTNGARVGNIDKHTRSQQFPECGEPSRLTVITTGHEDYRARGAGGYQPARHWQDPPAVGTVHPWWWYRVPMGYGGGYVVGVTAPYCGDTLATAGS